MTDEPIEEFDEAEDIQDPEDDPEADFEAEVGDDD